MREQFREAMNRMGGNPREHVLEPGERFDGVPLAGCHETPQHRRRLAALVAAKEGPVAAANREPADGPLSGVMPTPGLCRVRGLLSLPAVVSMLPGAA